MNHPLKALLLSGILLVSLPTISGQNAAAQAGETEGVFVLGVDGMDPTILTQMMAAGDLPNLATLAKEGAFQTLETTTPPQSPVAWSTFVTGMDPGGHGLFDFVHRDPATYAPISSATPPPEEPGAALHLFGYVLPLSGASPANNRSGIPFWDPLTQAGVDVEVYRIPGNYPVPDSEAKVLSGMGTVDMRGGYGTYTWYTDQPLLGAGNIKGDVQVLTVSDLDLDGIPDTATGSLKGPPDLFHLEPGAHPGPNDYLTARLTLHIDPEEDVALIDLAGERVVLQEGEWSDWIPVRYDALPLGLAGFDGTVRFYAKELRPNLKLYASPVNISAESPAQTISSPAEFATDLFAQLGHYYTQGMPEETNALKDGTLNDDDYVRQVQLVQDDSSAMLDLALQRFAPGDTTFFYLSDIDLQCHMLWRHGDPKDPTAPPHPAYEEGPALKHADDIHNYYKHVDGLLARVRQQLPADTLLIVMSDHGFQPFTRQAHLNAWLRNQGWLHLKDNKRTGMVSTDDMDWSATRAYGIGFNGLYLNRKGREGKGIVEEAEVDGLLDELIAALLAWRDPVTGEQVVLEVAKATEVYSANRILEAPDLIIGYNAGYGASDKTTLGEVTELELEDNTTRWSGNHLMAPSVVPGVVLVNRQLATSGLGLPDITATILHHYGLPLAPGMVGHSMFR